MAFDPMVDSPRAPGYASPLVDFSPLARLGDQFFKGRENTFADQQRQRQLELQKPITGNDPGAIVQDLMRRGGSEYAAQFLPFLQQQQAAQPSPLLGGGAPATARGPALPQGAPSAAPMAQPVPQQPQPGGPPSEVPAGNTLTGIAIGHYGADKGPQVAANAAKVLKIDPDTVLTPEQQQKVTAAFAGASGRPVTPPVTASPISAPAEFVLPNDPSTGQPFADPKKAIVALRREGARLVGSPYSAAQGKELLDWAKEIESQAFGKEAEARRQFNITAEGQKVPPGYERVAGGLRPTLGGPSDPAAQLTPVKIGVGPFGEDIMGVRDPLTSGYRRIDPKTGQLGASVQPSDVSPASSAAAASPKPAAGMSAKDMEIDTKAGRNVDFLATLEPEQRDLVRKIANNEMDPRSLSIKGGHRERILAAVATFDPTYDQKNYASFAEGLKKFQSGKQGDSVKSFNVGIEHIDQLLELGKALNTGNIQKINELSNWVKKNLGQEAPTNFNGLKQIVGAEIVKAIVGAGGGVSEREEAAKTISGASSPAQMEGIAKTYQTAMGAQLGGLQRQYEQATGRKDFDRLLSAQAIRARDIHNAALATLPAVDKQALDWANANPSDPRATAIKERLKVK